MSILRQKADAGMIENGNAQSAETGRSLEKDFPQQITHNPPKGVNIAMIKPPMIHRTYISGIKPDMMVYVANVNTTHSGENRAIGFIVECCDPAYKDDEWNADGYEMTDDVWAKYEFSMVPE
ncbi:MAG: hypothetical protein WCA64_11770 [Gallionella sp.]